MTIGEKIKELRKKENLSQEEFAERLNVSRSAVAKWETNNGVPEIGNLKMIADFFSVSIDFLLNDVDREETSPLIDKAIRPVSTYINEYKDIELTGWNDNVYKVLIFGEDEEFYYYQYTNNDRIIFGMIGKKYIKEIVPSKKSKNPEYEGAISDRNYLCNKPVLIERAHRDGIIKGFFDFRNDDYQEIRIKEFKDSEIQLDFGGVIPISDICKIEELPK